MTPTATERDYSLTIMMIVMLLMAALFFQQVAMYTSLLG
jgi:hypothetical protein